MIALLSGPLLGWVISAPLVPWTATSVAPRLLAGVALGAAWPLATVTRHAWALHRDGASWRGVVLLTLLAAAPQGVSMRRIFVGPTVISGVVSEVHCAQATATRRQPAGGCRRCTVRVAGQPPREASCFVAAELRPGDRLRGAILEDWLLDAEVERPAR